MAEPTDHTDVGQAQHVVQDMIDQLDAILVDLRIKVADPAALGEAVESLAVLVDGGLEGLVGMEAGPETKAQMVRLRAQIAELEQNLQNQQSILAGFSIYLRELVEG